MVFFFFFFFPAVVHGGSPVLPRGRDRGYVRLHRLPDDGRRRDRRAKHVVGLQGPLQNHSRPSPGIVHGQIISDGSDKIRSVGWIGRIRSDRIDQKGQIG